MDLECLRERSSGKLVESVPKKSVIDVLEKARCPVGEVGSRSGRHVFPPRYPKGTSLTDGDCKALNTMRRRRVIELKKVVEKRMVAIQAKEVNLKHRESHEKSTERKNKETESAKWQEKALDNAKWFTHFKFEHSRKMKNKDIFVEHVQN